MTGNLLLGSPCPKRARGDVLLPAPAGPTSQDAGSQRNDPVEFVARHGVVLASGKGRVPNLAEAIAGEPIRGGWWGHPKGREIFRALGALDDSPDVLCLRLIERKITFVHRRLWPALVRLAAELGKERLTAIRQEHTKTGAHRNVLTPFPKWVPAEIKAAAGKLSEADAREQLGPWATGG